MELFSLPETLSPDENWRREFINKFHVKEEHTEGAPSPHHAYIGEWRAELSEFTTDSAGHANHARSQTRHGALEALAIKLNHPLRR